jgi:Uma2 family endonuclease
MTVASKPPTRNTLESGPYRFTFEQFERLSDEGFFLEDHVELLNGEIYVKGRQNPPHAQAVRRLTSRLERLLGEKTVISSQLPLVLLAPPPDFVEPDLALLRLPSEQYEERNPTASDALLVIELSDSTLERDRGAKLEAYARNNVQEYWILNLNADELEVYRDPKGTKYRRIITLEQGQTASPFEFEDVKLEWW